MGGGGGGAASGGNIPQYPNFGTMNAYATGGTSELFNQGQGLQGLFNTYGVNTTPYESPANTQLNIVYPSWMSGLVNASRNLPLAGSPYGMPGQQGVGTGGNISNSTSPSISPGALGTATGGKGQPSGGSNSMTSGGPPNTGVQGAISNQTGLPIGVQPGAQPGVGQFMQNPFAQGTGGTGTTTGTIWDPNAYGALPAGAPVPGGQGSGAGWGTPGSGAGQINLGTLGGIANELGAVAGSGFFPSYNTQLGPGGPTNGGLVNLLQPTNYTSQQGVNTGQAVQASVLGLPQLAYGLASQMQSGFPYVAQENQALQRSQAPLQAAMQGVTGAAQSMNNPIAGIGRAAQNVTGVGNEINAMVPGAQTAANSMLGYVDPALTRGFDPQNALYAQDLQAVTDAAAAQGAASGTATSPFGSMATGRAVSEFENQWNQQQIANQSTAAQTANTLLSGQQIPAGMASQAGALYDQAGQLYGTQGGLVGEQGSLFGAIPGMLSQNVQNYQLPIQGQATAAGQAQTIGSTLDALLGTFNAGMTGGSDTAQNSANNVLNALSGLTGIGNQAATQQQMAVADALSYMQAAVEAAKAQTSAAQSEQAQGQAGAGMAGQALGSIGGLMGGK